MAERGWVEVDELRRLTGEERTATLGRWVADPAAVEATRAALRAAVEDAGPLGADLAMFDERQRAVLATLDDLAVEGGRVRRRELADPLAEHPYLAALDAAPFASPAPEGVDRAELRELVRRGLVVAQDGVWFSTAAVEAAARRVAELGHPARGRHDVRPAVAFGTPANTPSPSWRSSTAVG